jgi:hypothetical protein
LQAVHNFAVLTASAEEVNSTTVYCKVSCLQ